MPPPSRPPHPDPARAAACRAPRLMQRLARLWYRPARLALLLAPLALLYGVGVRLRRWLYRAGMLPTTRLAPAVVIVGNINAGGTGKTPLVQWLAARLAEQGRRPAIVCRSYAAAATAPARVRENDDPAVRGDEAVLLAGSVSCPVWSGPDRSETARAAAQAHPEVDTIICDDGLQHYALERDVEIVVVDAMLGFGNGMLLPAGPLREPRSRLASVAAVVVNGSGTVAGIPAGLPILQMALQGAQLRNLARPGRIEPAAAFRGKRLVAIAGIGNPARFFAHLESLGLQFDAVAFPDHHRFEADEVRFPDADAIVMTEKDAIKCAAFSDARMWSVPVNAVASDALVRLVLDAIARSRRAAHASGGTG